MILAYFWPPLCVFTFWYMRRKNAMVALIPIILPPLFSLAINWYITGDTERIGGYVKEVWYYEDWNEYVHQTCTKTTTDSKGRSTTTSYDCSYVRYHPEYHEVKTTIGDFVVDKSQYDRLRYKFNNRKFHDMYRHYHTNDGDAYVTYKTSIEPVTSSHSFTNKILANTSLFGFSKVSPEQAKKLGLYEWPEISLFGDNPILGWSNSEATAKLSELNAIEGTNKQIRVWLLIWHDKPHSIVQAQKSFWHGGKKNELVLCVGINNNRIIWADGFCWSPDGWAGNKETILKWQDSVLNKPLNSNIANIDLSSWKRKPFKEFEYIHISYPIWMHLLTNIVTLCSSLLIIWVVANGENSCSSIRRFRKNLSSL